MTINKLNNSKWNQFVSHRGSLNKTDVWVSTGNLLSYRTSDVCTQKHCIYFQILFFSSTFSGTNNFEEWGDFILGKCCLSNGNKE